jgi:osmotically-inducible protein OsmY
LINLALRPSPSRRSLELNVATKNGAVTISGEAADDAAKARITKLAESIRGVKSVSNEMVVKA